MYKSVMLRLFLAPSLCLFSAIASATLSGLTDDWLMTHFVPEGTTGAKRVAQAGDVNGDGYDDVIVGDPSHDKVYAYLGSPDGISHSTSWTVTATTTNGTFGANVAGVGDINGDGKCDIIVGNTYGAGTVYVWYGGVGTGPGGPSASVNETTCVWTATGVPGDIGGLGFTVGPAGDVNGDGYADVCAGSLSHAYVWMTTNPGTPALQAAPVFVYTQPDDQNKGVRCGTAGDTNMDGCAEFWVGTPDYHNPYNTGGEVRVFTNVQSGSGSAMAWRLVPNNFYARLGSAVSTAGDVDGDGRSDLVVGSGYYGEAYVFLGKNISYASTVTTVASASWTFRTCEDYYISVAFAGDTNADGYGDILIGLPTNNTCHWNSRYSMYLFNGGPDTKGPGSNNTLVGIEDADWKSPEWTLSNPEQHLMGPAGDVNGDGYSDVLQNMGGTPGQFIKVYHAGARGLGSPSLSIPSEKMQSYFGFTVASAGDVNNDGYSDMLVGQPFYTNGQTREGRVLLYLGSDKGYSVNHSWTVESNLPETQLGTVLSTAGDINGDGYDDVALGAPLYNSSYQPEDQDEGAVFVYLGSAAGLSKVPGTSTALSYVPDWIALGKQSSVTPALPAQRFGSSLACAGDVNGDGYSDLAIGSPYFDSDADLDKGGAFLFYGSPTGFNYGVSGSNPGGYRPEGSPWNADWSVEGVQPNEYLGCSVSGAGDVNADGLSDLIVGARGYTGAQATEGAVFAYYGAASGPSAAPSWSFPSGWTGAGLGYAVAGIGDVNSDGFSDIAASFPNYGNGGVLVILGSASGLEATPTWNSDSAPSGGTAQGVSVGAAGDLNNDGYSDFYYAVPNADIDAVTGSGGVYVIHGSATGPGTLPVMAVGTGKTNGMSITGTGLAYSPIGAYIGDANGDGFSDFAMGAPGYGLNSGDLYRGQARVYYGNRCTGKGFTFRQRTASGYRNAGGFFDDWATSPPVLTAVAANPGGPMFSGIQLEFQHSLANTVQWGLLNPSLTFSTENYLAAGMYSWRTHVKYNLGQNPYMRRGPWFSMQGNAPSAPKYRNRQASDAPVLSLTPPATPNNLTSLSITPGGTNCVAYRYKFDDAAWSREYAFEQPINLSGLAQGDHTLLLIARNSRGLLTTTPSSVTWSSDFIPPSEVALTRTAPTTSPTANTTASFTIGGDGVAAYKYTLDGIATDIEAPVAQPLELSGLDDGLHTLLVIGRTAVGNWIGYEKAPSSTWIVLATPPTAELTHRGFSNLGTTATFEVGGNGVVAYKYNLDAGAWSESIATTNPTFEINGLSDGTHTVCAIGVNEADIWQSESTCSTFTVDTSPPYAGIVLRRLNQQPVPAHPISDTSMGAMLMSTSGLVAYKYKLDNDPFSAEITEMGQLTVTGIGEGKHRLSVLIKNGLGIWQPTDSPSVSEEWTVDFTKPTIELVGENPLTVEVGTTYSEPGATARDNVDGDISENILITGTINTSVEGPQTLRYNTMDSAENEAIEVVRTVNVTDTKPPVITLNGASPLILEVFTDYTEFGATAIDALDGDITSDIEITNNSNTSSLGAYSVFYSATDAHNNSAYKTRTVHVVDTQRPVISLVGSATVSTERFAPYSDAGATALDNFDGNLTGSLANTDNLDVNVAGTYTITYAVSDSSGNRAIPVVRHVTVLDVTPPTATVTLVAPNATYTQETASELTVAGAGVEAYRYSLDSGPFGAETPVATPIILSGLPEGTHRVAVIGGSGAGNWQLESNASLSEVWYVDLTAPVITLIGASPMIIEGATPYMEPGATASDNVDGNITSALILTGAVNDMRVATYAVEYSVTDRAGHTSQITRTVQVQDTTPPVITLNGDSPFEVEVFADYAEPGATAMDAIEGPVSVAVSGTVDNSVLAEYTITYTAQDSRSNQAEETRLVKVVDTTPPVITLLGDDYLEIEAGSEYTDAGATAEDNFDGDLSDLIVVSNSVNTAIPSLYTITYDVFDSSHNPAAQVTRTVRVMDFARPTSSITVVSPLDTPTRNTTAEFLIGGEGVVSYRYSLDGTVLNLETAVSTHIFIAGLADGEHSVAVIGKNVANNWQLESDKTQSPTWIVDTTPPEITLVGGNTMHLGIGEMYIDPGYASIDTIDGDVTANVQTTGSVNTATEGVYTLNYAVTDRAGNTGYAKRLILVGAVAEPVVTLNGGDTVLLEAFDAYVELGASAYDLADGDLTGGILIVGTVNPDQLGTNEITYSVTDSDLNDASAIRTVNVVDTTIPVITLNGDELITIPQYGDYSDDGATASDAYDGNLTTGIVTANPQMDTAVPGVYSFTYNVVDLSGNHATQAVRTILVIDTTPPTATATLTTPVASPTNQRTATITVGGDDVESYRYKLNNGSFGSQIAVSTPITLTNLPEGVHQVGVIGKDSAGNWQTEASVSPSWTVDLTPPVITVLGDNPLDHEAPTAYVDPGVTVIDSLDGDISSSVLVTGYVDATTLGSYTLNYDAADAAGNAATQKSRAITVKDTTGPVITLSGNEIMYVEVHTTFEEPGYAAEDAVDGIRTVIVSGNVDTHNLGQYEISYESTDAHANRSVKTRSVHVVDTTLPVITLIGDTELTIGVGQTYTDLGATASDNYDGNLTADIVPVNPVNTSEPGTYRITYDVIDSSGNHAVQIVRTVHVVLQAPTASVTLVSPLVSPTKQTTAELTVAGLNVVAYKFKLDEGSYSLETAVATPIQLADLSDGSHRVSVIGVSAAGVWQEESNPSLSQPWSVDNTPPVLTLLNDNPFYIEYMGVYREPGATALDAQYGDLSTDIQIAGFVNTGTLGTYPVTYNVSDPLGNSAEEQTRSVVVRDSTPPVITLNGDPVITLEVFQPYSELFATASDAYDGDLTLQIEREGSVDYQHLGSYELVYSVTDTNGNTATRTRVVNVVDTVPPVVSLLGDLSITIEATTPYTDPGATASDNYDGNLTERVTIAGSVNTNLPGTYILTFVAVDSSYNLSAAATRTVTVIDTTPPVITLLGSNPVSVNLNETFTDAGATAFDGVAGDCTARISRTGLVNTTLVGSYAVNYRVSDFAGNISEALRLVNVVDPVSVEDATDLWTALPAFAESGAQDLSVDQNNHVWVISGTPISTTLANTTDIVNDRVHFVSQLQGTAEGNALQFFDGTEWHSFPAVDLGHPGALFTSVLVDGTTLWIGTNEGLLKATIGEGPSLVVDTFLDNSNGLAGSWITRIISDKTNGLLYVTSRESRYFRLHTEATRHYPMDGGGVSLWNGESWTAHKTDVADTGLWQGISGRDITCIAPLTSMSFWSSSETGLSLLDGATWSYQNVSTGMPDNNLRAVTLSSAETLWTASTSGISRQRSSGWKTWNSANSPLLSNAVNDLVADANSVLWTATDRGIMSYEPNTFAWRDFSSVSSAGARLIRIGPDGNPWTALYNGTILYYTPSLDITLGDPANNAILDTDASGKCPVTFTWSSSRGAEWYELFVNEESLGRTRLLTRTVVLDPGDYVWTARAIHPGNVAGAKAKPKAFSIRDGREPGVLEVLMLNEPAGGAGARYVIDAYKNPAGVWGTGIIAPGFTRTETGQRVDIAALANRSLASAFFADGKTGAQQYPTPFAKRFTPISSAMPGRIDPSSEPGGLALGVIEGAGAQYNMLFGDSSGGYALNALVPGGGYTQLVDLAGVAKGRVALLAAKSAGTDVVMMERLQIRSAARINGSPVATAQTGLAIAGFKSGGYAVLTATDVLVTRDEKNWVSVSLADAQSATDATLVSPKDLAIDNNDIIYVLYDTDAGQQVVMYLREVAGVFIWKEAPFAATGTVSGVACYMSPIGLFTKEPVAYNPPLEAADPGQVRTLPNPSDNTLVVDNTGGFDTTSDPGTVWAQAGEVFILRFLRVQVDGVNGARYLKWQPGTNVIYGKGDLYLAYNSLTGFPGPILLLKGEFSIDLVTGVISRLNGATLEVTLPVLGPINASIAALNVLGMGDYADSTSRTGVVVTGSTANPVGGLGTLDFGRYFMADFGGSFQQTFGKEGVAGLLPPFNDGTLKFADDVLPMTFHTYGEMFESDHLEFPAVSVDVGAHYTLMFQNMNLSTTALTFGESMSDFEQFTALKIGAGGIHGGPKGTGIYGGATTIWYGNLEKMLDVTNLFAETSGLQFDESIGFTLSAMNTLLQNIRLSVASAKNVNGYFDVETTKPFLPAMQPDVYEARLYGLRIPFLSQVTITGGKLTKGILANPDASLEFGSNVVFNPKEITVPAFRYRTKNRPWDIPLAGGSLSNKGLRLDNSVVTVLGLDMALSNLSFGPGWLSAKQASIPIGSFDNLVFDSETLQVGGGAVTVKGMRHDVAAFTLGAGWDLPITQVGVTGYGGGTGSLIVTPQAKSYEDQFELSDMEYETPETCSMFDFGNIDPEDFFYNQDGDVETYQLSLPLLGPSAIKIGTTKISGVFGHVKFKNSEFMEVKVGLNFSQTGGSWYNPLTGLEIIPPFVYLQSVDGTYNHPRLEGTIHAQCSLGKAISVGFLGIPDPYHSGETLQKIALVTIDGTVSVSGLGYIKGEILSRILGIFPMDRNLIIVGNVYMGSPTPSFIGTGFYARSDSSMFGGVMVVSIVAYGYDNGNWGAAFKGVLKVPDPIPVVGGLELGSLEVGIDNTGFHGKACINLVIFQACIGIRIDNNGVSFEKRKGLSIEEQRIFDEGYHYDKTRMSFFTNYKPLGMKTLAKNGVGNAKGTRVIPFDVPEGVANALVRTDFTHLQDNVNMSIRFPDGTVYTPSNTPEFRPPRVDDPAPAEGQQPIFYRQRVQEGATPEESIKEASYMFSGPVRYVDDNGNPADASAGHLAQTYIPAGRYEVTLSSEGNVDDLVVQFLHPNLPPKLNSHTFEALGEHRYHVGWNVSDSDNDDVVVKVHVGTDLNTPQNSHVLGELDGYPVSGGVTSLDIDLHDLDNQNLTATPYLFLSISDGVNQPEEYIFISRLERYIPANLPNQVQNVVALAKDGAIDVYWDPLEWTTPSKSIAIVAYGVSAEEVGPTGTTGNPVNATIPPDTTQATLTGLVNGRNYCITVTAVAEEDLVNGAKTSPSGTITKKTHTGVPSLPVFMTPVSTTVNNPPRFLSTPGTKANLGTVYRCEVRTEDLDNDAVALSVEAVVDETTKAKALPNLHIEYANNKAYLVLDPAEADLGRFLLTLTANDGKGGIATQKTALEVLHHAQGGFGGVVDSIPPATVYVGETYTYQVKLNGLQPDEQVRFGLFEAPAGMTINPTTAEVVWTPVETDIGSHDVVISINEPGANECATCTGKSLLLHQYVLSVLQHPLTKYTAILSVTPSIVQLDSTAGGAVLSVSNTGTGALNWTASVSQGAEWLHISGDTAGSDAGVITISADANASDTTRTGTVSVESAEANNGAVEVLITQAADTSSSEGEDITEQFQIVSPADNAQISIPSDAVAYTLNLATTDIASMKEVAYALDGRPVGTSQDSPFALVAEISAQDAGFGSHALTAVGTLTSGATVTTESSFTLTPIPAGADTDANGLPDLPFGSLPNSGDMWQVRMGSRMISAVRFESTGVQSLADIPVSLSVGRDNAVTASAHRNLMSFHESGILILQASDTLEGLFGPAGTELLTPEPINAMLVSGGQYVEASIITSLSEGIWSSLNDARLATNPVRLTMDALSFSTGTQIALYAHPTQASVDSPFTIVPEAGSWTAGHGINTALGPQHISADLIALSVFAPYETQVVEGQPVEEGQNPEGSPQEGELPAEGVNPEGTVEGEGQPQPQPSGQEGEEPEPESKGCFGW